MYYIILYKLTSWEKVAIKRKSDIFTYLPDSLLFYFEINYVMSTIKVNVFPETK